MDRLQELEQTRTHVRILLDELDLSPETSFERTVINTDEDTFVLSDDNMQNLCDYFGKVSCPCAFIELQNLEFYIIY